MKIQYKFATETVTIEVDDRWGELLVDLNRQEYNNDHKETRRHSSMDALAEQGVQFAAEQDALAALFQSVTTRTASVKSRMRASPQPTSEPERTAPFFAAAMSCRMSGTRCSMGRFVVNFGSVGSQK